MKKLFVLILACMISNFMFSQENYWTPVVSADYWALTSAIYIDGVQQTSDQIEVGAFCGDECRGSMRIGHWTLNIPNGPTFENDVVFQQIYGDTGDEITFKLYDHNTNQILDLDSPDPISWNKDLSYGAMEPFEIHFTTPSTTYPLSINAWTENGGFYLISSPIGDVATSEVEGLTTGTYDLYSFDQTKELEWRDMHDGGTLNAGQGYLYASQAGTTLQFTGTAYTSTGTFPLTYSETNSDQNMWGWNLMGNPFAVAATVDRSFYVMNSTGDDIIAGSVTVPAMNGIFVKATTEGENVTFTQSGTDNKSQIVLNVLKDRAAAIDRAIVRFDENSTLPKFMLDESNTKVYIPQNGSQYAVVNGGNENSLPVNFKAKTDGTYTLSVEINEVSMDYLHLIDNMTGADVDLLVQPSYQFSATSHDYESRFTLVFRTTTGVEEHSQKTFCFVNGRNLYFCEDIEGATLSLVDMSGRTVRHETLKGNGVSLANLSEGVYVVRLSNGNETKTQKIVVR